MRVKVHVKRGREGAQYYQTYEVEAPESTTVLDLLLSIRETLDGSLSMRYACRMGVCGACTMVINGVPRLACAVKISDLKTDEIFVEPLRGKKVIKDLVTE
ncbi:2Fe-2S iron-sulfur cluster-binding protein [Pyrobaculum neutrophilum]|uniref:Ferredoxin n=1 Tax=Pyrobaculum neutrophilum (strain DSM 2338 / JCM 9278 / NBRC 100436 / V24Sta) TaxID=444157 RepID=B1YBY8_PYRNV|nr:2Fe-2S iron-sulfur cluster-binding protein [Pyrobaculum neutrophilum]ACB39372.1 ferredoxin [Pyrobaculum neutrophilum V24Sta]